MLINILHLLPVHFMCQSLRRGRGGGGGGAGSPCNERKGGAGRKIRIKPLLDINLGVVQLATFMYSWNGFLTDQFIILKRETKHVVQLVS